jgi:hypothetical protein
MIKYRKYNEVGHTCEQTWRVALTVADVLALMKDDPDAVRSHIYDTEAADREKIFASPMEFTAHHTIRHSNEKP